MLSAYQSGVSRLLCSNEPMGLIRGFLTAGARLVLATLWPVEDLPTYLFRIHFNDELLNQMNVNAQNSQSVNPAAALA